MTRKAGAFMLLAALGGGCTSMDKTGPALNPSGATARARQVPGVQGPFGEPVAMTAQTKSAVKPAIATQSDQSSGVIQAGAKVKKGAPGMPTPPPGAVAALG